MSWKRYFTTVDTDKSQSGNFSPLGGMGNNTGVGPAQANYSSYLPDVYVGSPNRIERYGQYNTMDMDSEVNAALDILAEFCTQKNKTNSTNFTLDFKAITDRIENEKKKFELEPIRVVASEEEVKDGAPAEYTVPVTFDQASFFA